MIVWLLVSSWYQGSSHTLVAHHSKEQTQLSKKQYAAWLEAREAIGITQPHDTKFIDDPAEAEKVGPGEG